MCLNIVGDTSFGALRYAGDPGRIAMCNPELQNAAVVAT
jgi:hypothetical protein